MKDKVPVSLFLVIVALLLSLVFEGCGEMVQMYRELPINNTEPVSISGSQPLIDMSNQNPLIPKSELPERGIMIHTAHCGVIEHSLEEGFRPKIVAEHYRQQDIKAFLSMSTKRNTIEGAMGHISNAESRYKAHHYPYSAFDDGWAHIAIYNTQKPPTVDSVKIALEARPLVEKQTVFTA
jgi:hypothetical protein